MSTGVEFVPAHARLPLAHAEDFSVLSYNVLHPNSVGGWWLPKFYKPSVPRECTRWAHRAGLLRAQLLGSSADVLCLQEVVPESFAQDFGFLAEAGYEHALHKKGDLRCCTFWRGERFCEAAPALHRDRTLTVTLRQRGGAERVAHVVNVHLKAGREPARRLRQTHEACEALERELARGRASFERAAVVVAGDFNAAPEGSAVAELLERGLLAPAFREPREPDLELTSRERRQPFGPVLDAYALAYGEAAPPTLVVPEHLGFFLDAERAGPSPALLLALERAFARLASGAEVLDREAIERWIVAVNEAPARGSEWRKAQDLFSAKGREELTLQDFARLYWTELLEGKPWSVLHDLWRCGGLTELPPSGLWSARFDRVAFAERALSLRAVRALWTEQERAALFEERDTLPNAWHPSDHLPVAAVLRFRE